MSKEMRHIDISNLPDVMRLAEDVLKAGEPTVLRRDSEDVAVLLPVTSSTKYGLQRTISRADREAFLSAAGSWEDIVDTEQLKDDIYRSRGSDRPLVDL